MREDDEAFAPPLCNFDRRTLLSGAIVAFGGFSAACPPSSSSSATDAGPAPSASSGDADVDAIIPVLVALAARLVPADELGPGAMEADVETYFRRALVDARLANLRAGLMKGCAFVQLVAQREQSYDFAALVPDVQDGLITRFVDNTVRPDGFSMQTFLRAVMALTLEGYLGDPRHGGNAGGIGWRVVGYAPEGRAQGLALQVLP
jgi:gluconate 2-dehydrogenase gamma chain